MDYKSHLIDKFVEKIDNKNENLIFNYFYSYIYLLLLPLPSAIPATSADMAISATSADMAVSAISAALRHLTFSDITTTHYFINNSEEDEFCLEDTTVERVKEFLAENPECQKIDCISISLFRDNFNVDDSTLQGYVDNLKPVSINPPFDERVFNNRKLMVFDQEYAAIASRDYGSNQIIFKSENPMDLFDLIKKIDKVTGSHHKYEYLTEIEWSSLDGKIMMSCHLCPEDDRDPTEM